MNVIAPEPIASSPFAAALRAGRPSFALSAFGSARFKGLPKLVTAALAGPLLDPAVAAAMVGAGARIAGRLREAHALVAASTGLAELLARPDRFRGVGLMPPARRFPVMSLPRPIVPAIPAGLPASAPGQGEAIDGLIRKAEALIDALNPPAAPAEPWALVDPE